MSARLRLLRRIQQPVNVPELMRSGATMLFALSSLIALVVVYQAKNSAEAVTGCRSKLASSVTDAQTDYLFAMGSSLNAIGDLVIDIAQRSDTSEALKSLGSADTSIASAAKVLDRTRNARISFEDHPTGSCPTTSGAAPRVPLPTSTTSTSMLPTLDLAPGVTTPDVTSTTVRRTVRKNTPTTSATTTTQAPATTKPRPSTTTTQPCRITLPYPTIITGIPCL